MSASAGFPPVCRADARILVLGSLPGVRSIEAQQYYAHPQNSFWRIMRALLGVEGGYDERCQGLVEHRIALWDVLESSIRPGSMDADIELDSACVNDFPRFLELHDSIRLVAFNGRKAAELFSRFVDDDSFSIATVALPSTSAAYAAMPFAGKLELWRQGLQLENDNKGR